MIEVGPVQSSEINAQWEAWQAQSTKAEAATSAATVRTPGGSTPAAPAKKKLSYLEAREYSTIEQRVEEAEQLVKAKRAELEDPANAMDAPRLVSAQAALDAAQEALERPLRAMGGTGEEERVSSPGKPMSVTGAIACGC